jgi:hypothetical protein
MHWKKGSPVMKQLLRHILCLLAIGLLSACSLSQPSVTPAATIPAGFTENQAQTLASLKQVDEYPLYTMRYYGEYDSPRTSLLPAVRTRQEAGSAPGWACSLFTVLLDEDHLLYGRNFDWDFSPALLLFTDPPDGYASVSMVDFAYLGFSGQTVFDLTKLPLQELEGLLNAPHIPFDGMNEHGLAISMAAVGPGNMRPGPSKKTIGSLGIIREILDHARDVDEALNLIQKFNIDFQGGPPVHYLIADAKRQAVLVEFYQGKMHVFENEQPWHSATNFLRAAVKDPKGNCWRYDKINDRLNEKQGMLDPSSAMQMLSEVAQDSTQWSVVYQMGRSEVSVAMGDDDANVHLFQTSDYFDSK